MEQPKTIFELIGGEPTVRELVDRFYTYVEADEVLRPLFPDDLEEGKRYQYLFLMQYFGGGNQYQQERGHPRLRARHMPFAIDQQARDHWLTHMLQAIDDVGIEEPIRTMMRGYFERAASMMINRFDDEG